MNRFKTKYVLLNLLLVQLLFSQEKGFKIPDSLHYKSYPELGYWYYEYLEAGKSKISKQYAKAYIAKAKQEKDTLNIAEGFYYLGYISESDLALRYMDSIIGITKDLNNSDYPGKAYLFKGIVYSDKRVFKKALDNYVKANDYARRNHNSDLIFRSSYLIGKLKNRIGNYKEALHIYKEAYNYAVKNNLREKNTVSYLNTIFSLVTAFYPLEKLDSAAFYNNLGISESVKSKNTHFYNYFVLSSGVVLHLQQNHTAALDSIYKSLSYLEEINDKPNRAVSYYYLGKIYYETGFKEKGIGFLKKLDTIFQEQKDILPETIHGYEILINHYKKNNDIKNQLLYIEKMLQVDSVLDSNYRYIQKNVALHYDTPLLVAEKQEIINTLKKEKRYSYMGIVALTLISVLAIMLWLLSAARQKTYKKRFEALLRKTRTEKAVKKKTAYKEEDTVTDISEDIVTHILSCLDNFEQKRRYLTPDITVADLAGAFNTNAKYLSKVINVCKKKNFNTYINDLRIDYVVEKLQTDKWLRKYTIVAISGEVGFKSTQVFSKAFLKKTGIYPSYFIKALKKQQNG